MDPKTRKRIVRPLLAVLAVIGLYAAYLVSTNNFHTVVAGELYRSARPSPEDIAAWHKRYGIKTILNLQGPHPHAAWYRKEKAAAEALGITLIDHQMSAQREVQAPEVEQILEILSTARAAHSRALPQRGGPLGPGVGALCRRHCRWLGVLCRAPIDPLLRAPPVYVPALLRDGPLVRESGTPPGPSGFLSPILARVGA